MTTFSSSQPDDVQTMRCSLLTPPGRGALAVIGVAGGDAVATIDRLFAARGVPVAGRPDGAICFGTWRATGEDVVVVTHDRQRAEVHCHGGTAAAAAILAGLEADGARRVPWHDWPTDDREATCAGAALRALPFAGGPKAARILARQAAGSLDRELLRLEKVALAGDDAAARRAAARLLAAARVGLRLTTPWRIVLSGGVNAGKSSLMNALVGHGRSIVSPIPGTTRDVVTARAVIDGWEVDLVDVAGLRGDGADVTPVERAGMARAATERHAADLVLRVVPVDAMPEVMEERPSNELLVLSKGDLAPSVTRPHAITTSAVTGFGIDALIAAIIDRLVPEERRDPGLLTGPVPFTPWQVDLVRARFGGSVPAGDRRL
ncbi:MAG: 50S ribosome-binding GTPase [Planctomycetia bacterium]|nr:50S ribosome-binding GTPase [Planctomycetia bacterium]